MGKQIAGNTTFIIPSMYEQNYHGLQFSEEVQNSSPCNLTNYIGFSSKPIILTASGVLEFQYKQHKPSGMSLSPAGYVPQPGLSTVNIIFPFHTFL